jgi:hypothetical protein
MRVLVTGSRDWSDEAAVCTTLTELLRLADRITVVHGACPTGADAIAHRWASDTPGATPEPHPADWSIGKKAGPLRNQAMVDLGADVCLAFPVGESRGTRDCMRRAEAAGIPVQAVTV